MCVVNQTVKKSYIGKTLIQSLRQRTHTEINDHKNDNFPLHSDMQLNREAVNLGSILRIMDAKREYVKHMNSFVLAIYLSQSTYIIVFRS